MSRFHRPQARSKESEVFLSSLIAGPFSIDMLLPGYTPIVSNIAYGVGVTIVDVAILMARSLTCSDVILYTYTGHPFIVSPLQTFLVTMYLYMGEFKLEIFL